MAATSGYALGPRRRHLEALAREVEARGLQASLTEDLMLRVVDPPSGHGVLVVAMPMSRIRWSYLWAGGGQADADDPARAAELIARTLTR
ncbi:hypothetical protein [Actinoallomurus soli]|uniref:hypothetical protein n=1 Tax=Actinoallomurus soli TaxID=2952535 RepID=UPI0020920C98|nr:hypothetical protein [Actinoallomurus soli]MCO5974147.1 hypothetical protein [Actinoallomurus soli]